ncbi:YtxH domain-containing protein [Aquimarina addita]|uniref:YtxH domain-containing protein n=2 Tax=Aquimarina addita TaxID=870485 RepID=A0ABP7X7T8_9FLAO
MLNQKNIDMSNNSGTTFLGILAGTAIGATLGILFAPDKGSSTRKKISDEAILAKHNLSEKAYELKNNLSHTAAVQKENLDTRIESLVSDASYKAEDVITTLESKLRDLKAKNKKLQKTV